MGDLDRQLWQLKSLRELDFYEQAWQLVNEEPPGCDEGKAEYLRLCRATDRPERIDESDLRFSPAHDTDLSAMQLTVLADSTDRFEVSRRIELLRKHHLDGDARIACSIARAYTAFGQLDEARKAISKVDKAETSNTGVFATKLRIAKRSGDDLSLIHLCNAVGPEPPPLLKPWDLMEQLTLAGRALIPMGFESRGLMYLKKATELSVTADVRNLLGFTSPSPWRWLAHALTITGQAEKLNELYREVAEVPLWHSRPTPKAVRNLTIAESPAMRLEKGVVDPLWSYDGTDEPLELALQEIKAIRCAYGGSAELAWTRAQLLHRLNRPEKLSEFASQQSRNPLPRIEYAKLLNERGFHEAASYEVRNVLDKDENHPEALLLDAYITANYPSRDVHPEYSQTAARTAESASRTTAVVRRLLDRIPHDAPVLALAAERLAQNGHYTDAFAVFDHLTTEHPQFTLGWAGKLRAAAWRHDWQDVRHIRYQFPARCKGLFRHRFLIARALAYGNRHDYKKMAAKLEGTSGVPRAPCLTRRKPR